MMGFPIHPKVAEALQQIDAAVFNGNTFDVPENRAELKSYLERWLRNLTAPSEDYTKVVNYKLGAGPHIAKRFERDDGVVAIHAFNGDLVGQGNTARDAAVHLAEQLREIARLVEGHEGVRG